MYQTNVSYIDAKFFIFIEPNHTKNFKEEYL